MNERPAQYQPNLERYPVWVVMIANLVPFSLYLSGFLIMSRLGWIVAVSYLIFVALIEFRVISRHCINCYYWGKLCAFGKGRISSLFFKKGNAAKFCEKEMAWKDMIPDLLVSAIPVVTGVILLIIKFDLRLLVPLLILILMTTMGNAFVRGKLACKYCKQREIGCPADKLFNSNK